MKQFYITETWLETLIRIFKDKEQNPLILCIQGKIPEDSLVHPGRWPGFCHFKRGNDIQCINKRSSEKLTKCGISVRRISQDLSRTYSQLIWELCSPRSKSAGAISPILTILISPIRRAHYHDLVCPQNSSWVSALPLLAPEYAIIHSLLFSTEPYLLQYSQRIGKWIIVLFPPAPNCKTQQYFPAY